MTPEEVLALYNCASRDHRKCMAQVSEKRRQSKRLARAREPASAPAHLRCIGKLQIERYEPLRLRHRQRGTLQPALTAQGQLRAILALH